MFSLCLFHLLRPLASPSEIVGGVVALSLFFLGEESSIFRQARSKRRAGADFYSRPYVEATFTAYAFCCSTATPESRRHAHSKPSRAFVLHARAREAIFFLFAFFPARLHTPS